MNVHPRWAVTAVCVVALCSVSTAPAWAAGYTITGLGTLSGGTYSYANGINNNGQVVGYGDTASGYNAFLYSNGTMTDLGTLSGGGISQATGINTNGWVVGYGNTASSAQDAFLYSGGHLLDLNSLLSPGSGWTLQDATGINDLGQIVGTGTFNGQNQAFLMTPTPVPLPATAWLLGSGLLGLLGVARARRRG